MESNNNKKEKVMKMKKNSPMIPIYDINLAAFLQYRGTPPQLRKEGSRVTFFFPNDQKTCELMKSYNENLSVPVLDFVGHLRRLRSQMLSMRN
jgi:hypothetical protein